MSRAPAQVSPQLYARTIGVLYLIVIIVGFYAYGYVPGKLLQAWASLAIALHDADLNISFLFFGCVCLLYGYLIFRSRLLPRFLGVLMTLAGLCYGGNSVLVFLDLHLLPATAVPLLLLPAGLSELILCLWLLIMGVDAPKWHLWSEQSNRTGAADALDCRPS
jgi:Domain of unknown function (DUF4386)